MVTPYAYYLANHGGIANTGNYLGVIVAEEEHATQTPAGWCFVPLGSTPERVQEALDHMKNSSRDEWPSKDVVQKAPKIENKKKKRNGRLA